MLERPSAKYNAKLVPLNLVILLNPILVVPGSGGFGQKSRKGDPGACWLLLVLVLLFCGIIAAILTVANPPTGFADIRMQVNVSRFVSTAPVYKQSEFDSYHAEEQHEMAFGGGKIE